MKFRILALCLLLVFALAGCAQGTVPGQSEGNSGAAPDTPSVPPVSTPEIVNPVAPLPEQSASTLPGELPPQQASNITIEERVIL